LVNSRSSGDIPSLYLAISSLKIPTDYPVVFVRTLEEAVKVPSIFDQLKRERAP